METWCLAHPILTFLVALSVVSRVPGVVRVLTPWRRDRPALEEPDDARPTDREVE